MDIFIYVLVGIATVVAVSLNLSGKTEDDNIFEETTEVVIEQVTGLDVDLSPNSEE